MSGRLRDSRRIINLITQITVDTFRQRAHCLDTTFIQEANHGEKLVPKNRIHEYIEEENIGLIEEQHQKKHRKEEINSLTPEIEQIRE